MSASELVAAPARPAQQVTLELTGERTRPGTLLADLARSRGLLYMLARHDFAARYRSAALGLAWSVALPLLQGAVLAVVFTRIVPVRAGVSYPLFVLSGTTVWSYLSQVTQVGSTAIVDGADIATKLYFPRLLLPAVPVLAGAVSGLISTALVVVLLPVLGSGVHLSLLVLPAALLLAMALAALASALFAILHVYFRDVRYLVTALLLLAFYATPVLYPLTKPHGVLRTLVEVNPATGVLQLVRFCFFGASPGPLAAPLAATAAWLVALAGTVVVAYTRHERIACDRL